MANAERSRPVRRVSIADGFNGHDNHGFEIRKDSAASQHVELGPVRKKSILKCTEIDPYHSQTSGHDCGDPHHHHHHGDRVHNGPVKKYSSSSTQSKGHLQSVVEDDRSWWYIFCAKCNVSEEEAKAAAYPKFWPKMCPHPFCPSYRQFTRIVALCLIGTFTWCVIYVLLGDRAAPPHGPLFQLIILSISAHVGGWLFSFTTLPALVGMLFTGLLFQNVNIVNIDEDFTDITGNISNVALVIILIRAGLDLDPRAITRLKWTVLKLAVIPWIIEAVVVAVLSKYLLNLSWNYSVLLGPIIAAVAPAVIVPCLFRLRSKSYGVAKGIPTLIIAVASIDDATSVAIFGTIKSIMFSDSSLSSVILQGPLSILGGIGFGILWGTFCNYVPERNDPFVALLRVLLLLAGGMVAVFGSELIGYGGAGPLACVSAAFVALIFWSRHGWDVEDNPAATAFEIFWMLCQPILFGVTGARVKLHKLDGSAVAISVGILVAGVVIRILATTLVSIGSKLNLKERVFVSIAWMCKGIVQAALGPVALTIVTPGTEEYVCSEKILTISILSIIVTAPTGALLITLLGPQLLTKANLPTLPELRRRKRSRRLSIRDISIIDEEEIKNANPDDERNKEFPEHPKDGIV